MESLAQIQTKLKNVMLTSNIESPELDALCLLLANSIYQNQVNVTSAVVEMSPSKCIQLNSSIVHARDKGYSVYRGRNPHFKIKNAYVTKLHDMTKYSVFAETNNYKLVLAKDYTPNNSLSGNKIENLEVILTRDVLTESFTAEGLYSHTLSGTGISEDVSLFCSNGNSTSEWTEIDLVRSINDIKSTDNDMVAVITDTDYTIALYNIDKFKSDYAYICKYLPLISNDIGDTTEIMSKFKSFNGFALKPVKKQTTNIDGTTVTTEVIELDYEFIDEAGWSNNESSETNKLNYVSPRETNKDNIYLNSIYSMNTIRRISTENDIEYIFKSYKDFSKRFSGIKCVFSESGDKTQAKLFYVVNNIDASLGYRDLSPGEKSTFIAYLINSYYLEDTLIFTSNDINQVSGGDASGDNAIINPATAVSGNIIVHADKDILNEVISTANYYVKSNYKTKDGDVFCPAQWMAIMQRVNGVKYIEFDQCDLSTVLSNKNYKDGSEYIGKYIKDYIVDNDTIGGFRIELSED